MKSQLDLFGAPLPEKVKDPIIGAQIDARRCDMFGARGLESIEEGSVDLLIADLPYNTTECSWEHKIDLELFWKHIKRIVKEQSAILLFATQPFTTRLINSNEKGFCYNWTWNKSIASNFMNAKIQPLKYNEEILVFSTNNRSPRYFPQMEKREKKLSISKNIPSQVNRHGETKGSITDRKDWKDSLYREYTHKYPSTLLCFLSPVVGRDRGFHPTQKPVALLEYLIKTYSLEGEVVLDPCFGSGSTLLAAIKQGRKAIGFEREEEYFNALQVRASRLGVEVKGEEE